MNQHTNEDNQQNQIHPVYTQKGKRVGGRPKAARPPFFTTYLRYLIIILIMFICMLIHLILFLIIILIIFLIILFYLIWPLV